MNLRELFTIVGGRSDLPDPLPVDPLPILAAWLDAAFARKPRPNPHSVALATATPDGRPSARVVLCKQIDVERGAVVFYTNYESAKGRVIESNPVATMLFHWDDVAKQARVSGPVTRMTAAESDAYFATRPLLSKLGAWASAQSEPLAHRRDLVRAARRVAKQFGVSLRDILREETKAVVPRPPHWGGYRIWADRVELWCGDEGRLHDRAEWTRSVERNAVGEVRAAPWDAGERRRLQP